MGNIIAASCSCGYEGQALKQGFGSSYMDTGLVYAPVSCDACGITESVATQALHPACSQCNGPVKFYQLPAPAPLTLTGFPDSHDLDEQKSWHCPACKQDTLRFKTIALWD